MQGNTNQGNPPSRRPQQVNKKTSTSASNQINGAAAMASLGMSERVGSYIPTPSENIAETTDFTSSNEEVSQWKDPNESENHETYEIDDVESYKEPSKSVKSNLAMLHPVLRKLRQEFGIETVKTIVVEIGTVKWTMRALTQELMTFALRLADIYSASQSEHIMKLSVARASCSVVAIDGVPVYKLFDIKLEKEEKISDPLNPPPRIKQLSAFRVYDILMQESLPGLSKRLCDAYEERLEPETDVTKDNVFKSVYRCTKCGEEKKFIDKITEGGERLSYFCENDGAIMEPVLTSQEASDSPLE